MLNSDTCPKYDITLLCGFISEAPGIVKSVLCWHYSQVYADPELLYLLGLRP